MICLHLISLVGVNGRIVSILRIEQTRKYKVDASEDKIKTEENDPKKDNDQEEVSMKHRGL